MSRKFSPWKDSASVNTLETSFLQVFFSSKQRSSKVDYFENVKSGNGIILPPFIADSWASIPTQVMLADCFALG
jgi:hypothetical protein